jgi:hypothetical protein
MSSQLSALVFVAAAALIASGLKALKPSAKNVKSAAADVPFVNEYQ